MFKYGYETTQTYELNGENVIKIAKPVTPGDGFLKVVFVKF
jgi:hypothetical protein